MAIVATGGFWALSQMENNQRGIVQKRGHNDNKDWYSIRVSVRIMRCNQALSLFLDTYRNPMNELITNIILGAVFVAMIGAAHVADYYSDN